MFGNKQGKLNRLHNIGRIVKETDDFGITQAELARRVGVSRSTISKDLSIIRKKIGVLLSEDNGRIYWFDQR